MPPEVRGTSAVRYVLRRIVWVLAVPAASGFGAWGVLFLGDGAGAARLAISGVLPVLGLASVAGYRAVTGDPVRMGSYLPFGLAAVVYLPLMLQLAEDIQREPDAAVVPVAQFGIGFLLPWLALLGGLFALVPDSFEA